MYRWWTNKNRNITNTYCTIKWTLPSAYCKMTLTTTTIHNLQLRVGHGLKNIESTSKQKKQYQCTNRIYNNIENKNHVPMQHLSKTQKREWTRKIKGQEYKRTTTTYTAATTWPFLLSAGSGTLNQHLNTKSNVPRCKKKINTTAVIVWTLYGIGPLVAWDKRTLKSSRPFEVDP